MKGICTYYGCRESTDQYYFCTTKHAILDYLDTYGLEELEKIIKEWKDDQ